MTSDSSCAAPSPEPDGAEAARARCHILVEQLPSEGLGEAEESLVQVCDHYATPVEPAPVKTEPKVVTGRVTGSYVRPVVPVEGED